MATVKNLISANAWTPVFTVLPVRVVRPVRVDDSLAFQLKTVMFRTVLMRVHRKMGQEPVIQYMLPSDHRDQCEESAEATVKARIAKLGSAFDYGDVLDLIDDMLDAWLDANYSYALVFDAKTIADLENHVDRVVGEYFGVDIHNAVHIKG